MLYLFFKYPASDVLGCAEESVFNSPSSQNVQNRLNRSFSVTFHFACLAFHKKYSECCAFSLLITLWMV